MYLSALGYYYSRYKYLSNLPASIQNVLDVTDRVCIHSNSHQFTQQKAPTTQRPQQLLQKSIAELYDLADKTHVGGTDLPGCHIYIYPLEYLQETIQGAHASVPSLLENAATPQSTLQNARDIKWQTIVSGDGPTINPPPPHAPINGGVSPKATLFRPKNTFRSTAKEPSTS